MHLYIHPSILEQGVHIPAVIRGKAKEHTGKADRLHSHQVQHCEKSKQGSVGFEFDMTVEACVLLLRGVSLLKA